MEMLVGDEHMFEETAHDLGKEPWNRTFHQSVDSLLSVEEFLADDSQLDFRLLNLPYPSSPRIDIHEGEPYVGFRHDERV